MTLDNASQNSFCIDNNGFLGTTTTYSIILSSEYVKMYESILILLNSKLLTFYHSKNTIPQAGGFYRYQASFIKSLPIKNLNLTFVADILLLLINQEKKIGTSISDSLVYNIYFPDYMKALNIDVQNYIEQDIAAAMQDRAWEDLADEQKQEVIDQLHTTWTDPTNEVVKRMSQFKEKSPDILKVIMES